MTIEMRLLHVAAVVALLAACAPSPEQTQPADPLAGAGGVKVQVGGCSPLNGPCP